MHEIRDVELPYCGDILKATAPFNVSVVPLAQEDEGAEVLEPEFGVPLPVIVMPICDGTTIPVVQVHVPAGMLIVSPSTATCVGPLMTALTLL